MHVLLLYSISIQAETQPIAYLKTPPKNSSRLNMFKQNASCYNIAPYMLTSIKSNKQQPH